MEHEPGQINGFHLCTLTQGERITNVEKEEITVWVGSDQCIIDSIGATVIKCMAPFRDKPTVEHVTVSYINKHAE